MVELLKVLKENNNNIRLTTLYLNKDIIMITTREEFYEIVSDVFNEGTSDKLGEDTQSGKFRNKVVDNTVLGTAKEYRCRIDPKVRAYVQSDEYQNIDISKELAEMKEYAKKRRETK